MSTSARRRLLGTSARPRLLGRAKRQSKTSPPVLHAQGGALILRVKRVDLHVELLLLLLASRLPTRTPLLWDYNVSGRHVEILRLFFTSRLWSAADGLTVSTCRVSSVQCWQCSRRRLDMRIYDLPRPSCPELTKLIATDDKQLQKPVTKLQCDDEMQDQRRAGYWTGKYLR